jgi:hypothetical protein
MSYAYPVFRIDKRSVQLLGVASSTNQVPRIMRRSTPEDVNWNLPANRIPWKLQRDEMVRFECTDGSFLHAEKRRFNDAYSPTELTSLR